MPITERVVTVTNVSGEEARTNVGSETECLDIDHGIKAENVILNSLGSINIGPGAGGSNEGPFSGSINQAKGNLHHMEQYAGTMTSESIRGKGKRYQENEESVESCNGKMKKVSMETEEVEDVIEYKVEENEYAWLEASAVGHVSSLDYIPALHEIFEMKGYFNIAVIPLGGNMVLLKSDDTDLIREVVDNEQKWLSRWFERVKMWSIFEASEERFLWVKVTGIPLHAWNESCFKLIGNNLGQYVYADKHTLDRSCLDAARICIKMVGLAKINKFIKLKVNGYVFKIKVSEEKWRSDLEWWSCKDKNENGDDNAVSDSNPTDFVNNSDKLFSGQNSNNDGEDSMEEIEETDDHHAESSQRSHSGNFQKSYAEVCIVGGESGDCSWRLGNEVDMQSMLVARLEMNDQTGRIGFGQFVGLGQLDRGTSKANEEQSVGLIGESSRSQQNSPTAGSVTGDLHITNNNKSVKERKRKHQMGYTEGRRNQLRNRSNSSRIVGLSLSDNRIEQWNRIIRREQNREKARRLMDLRKQLDLRYRNNEEIRAKMRQVEERDRGD